MPVRSTIIGAPSSLLGPSQILIVLAFIVSSCVFGAASLPLKGYLDRVSFHCLILCVCSGVLATEGIINPGDRRSRSFLPLIDLFWRAPDSAAEHLGPPGLGPVLAWRPDKREGHMRTWIGRPREGRGDLFGGGCLGWCGSAREIPRPKIGFGFFNPAKQTNNHPAKKIPGPVLGFQALTNQSLRSREVWSSCRFKSDLHY